MSATHIPPQLVQASSFSRCHAVTSAPVPESENQSHGFVTHKRYDSRKRKGFTLIEILVVVSVLTLLLSLAANMAQEVVASNQLTTAGETVADELKLARHTALSKDRVVEVRFYRPDVVDGSGLPTGVSAVQSFVFDEDNMGATPMRELRRLPDSVMISEDSTLSSLLGESRLKADWKDGDEKVRLPGANTEYTTWRVRFLPDGSTDLDAQQQWFVTLHDRNARQSPPPNYVTVQIKPSHGTVRTFRP